MNQLFTALLCLFPAITFAAVTPAQQVSNYSPNSITLASQLGWVSSTNNNCGGYYLEQPFVYPIEAGRHDTVEITGNQGLFSLKGTSVLENKVSITRFGQQITADKGYQ